MNKGFLSPKHLLFPILLVAMILVGIGCQSNTQPQPATPAPSPNTQPVTQPPPMPDTELAYGYTHIRPDGNRFVDGKGSMPDSEPLDIELDGEPLWVVSVPSDFGSIWAVVLEDGRVQGFKVIGRSVEEVNILPQRLPPGTPPLLRVQGESYRLITSEDSEASPLTHPLDLGQANRQIHIDNDGGVVLTEGNASSRLNLNALPDARIIADENERLLVLSGGTERYAHAVVGDTVEAGSITLLETSPQFRGVKTITIPDERVVEGISPIWADLNDDGEKEIIVTLSDARQGAQIVAYSEDGELVASGPAIGRGGRWRHQLAVAPFGPNGETELVDVLTPHIGGVVEFYRMEDDQLRIVTSIGGYTSHVIGSRNLDMAVAGDFDGDGNMEILLPNQSREHLGAIRHTSDGAKVVWTVDLSGRLVTNLSAVQLSDGRIAVGAGQRNSILRLWLP